MNIGQQKMLSWIKKMKKNNNHNSSKLVRYSTTTPKKRMHTFQNKADDGSLLKSNITIKVSTFEECDSSLFINSDEK